MTVCPGCKSILLFYRTSDFETEITSSFRDISEEQIEDNLDENIFVQVDKLLEGTDTEKEKAHEILQRNRKKVIINF